MFLEGVQAEEAARAKALSYVGGWWQEVVARDCSVCVHVCARVRAGGQGAQPRSACDSSKDSEFHADRDGIPAGRVQITGLTSLL